MGVYGAFWQKKGAAACGASTEKMSNLYMIYSDLTGS